MRKDKFTYLLTYLLANRGAVRIQPREDDRAIASGSWLPAGWLAWSVVSQQLLVRLQRGDEIRGRMDQTQRTLENDANCCYGCCHRYRFDCNIGRVVNSRNQTSYIVHVESNQACYFGTQAHFEIEQC